MRQPFVPFRIHTSLGKNFDVIRPDNVLVLRSRLILGAGDSPNAIPDHTEHVTLLHIDRVEELRSASAD